MDTNDDKTTAPSEGAVDSPPPSAPSARPKPRSAAAGIASAVGVLIAVMRLVACIARQNHAGSTQDFPALPALTPSPDISCRSDCRLLDSLPSAYPSDRPTCEAMCIPAKTKRPSMDFPQSMRDCRRSCVTGGAWLMAAAAASAEEPDAGTRTSTRDAEAKAKVAPKTRDAGSLPNRQGPSPEAEKAAERVLAAMESCVPTCIDALATKGEFDPQQP